MIKNLKEFGYDGYFIDSDKCQVYSVDRHIQYSNGDVRMHKGKVLSLSNDKDGYKQMTLKSKSKKLHRLLAEVFIPNPFNLPMVNHKNGIKSDNSLSNLEWCTASENTRHALNIGLLREDLINIPKKINGIHKLYKEGCPIKNNGRAIKSVRRWYTKSIKRWNF